MRFPYHQVEEGSIEQAPSGSIQTDSADTNSDSDDSLLPSRSLLPYWPFWAGVVQIAVGFLCTALGAVHVFVVPVLISADADYGLYRFNCYGAAIWTGMLVTISGSCAVRASKKRDLFSVIQFYVVVGLSFLICLALFILILWCYIEITNSSQCNEMFPFPNKDCDFTKNKNLARRSRFFQKISSERVKVEIHKYAVISLLSAVWCLLGCMLLFLCTINYFCPVMFGEVHLLKKLGVCWLPCCFYLPPKEALETYTQEQTVNAKF